VLIKCGGNRFEIVMTFFEERRDRSNAIDKRYGGGRWELRGHDGDRPHTVGREGEEEDDQAICTALYTFCL